MLGELLPLRSHTRPLPTMPTVPGVLVVSALLLISSYVTAIVKIVSRRRRERCSSRANERTNEGTPESYWLTFAQMKFWISMNHLQGYKEAS